MTLIVADNDAASANDDVVSSDPFPFDALVATLHLLSPIVVQHVIVTLYNNASVLLFPLGLDYCLLFPSCSTLPLSPLSSSTKSLMVVSISSTSLRGERKGEKEVDGPEATMRSLVDGDSDNSGRGDCEGERRRWLEHSRLPPPP
ncbi:hypothetical protein GW17_00021126 [Ensete ventricosum]|nr:hypothetical protein GW17_00021126 [Ensete ventricosum]RZR90512.1 hypothetical protein BHM03_00018404 [Ensete ventricosum]